MAIGSAPEVGREFLTGAKHANYPWVVDGVQHQLMWGDSKVVYICGHPNNIYSKFEWQCHKGCCGHDQGEPVDAPVEKEDLVESLLNMGELINQSRGIANVLMLSGDMFLEAAAEIERLNTKIENLQAHIQWLTQVAQERIHG